MKKLKNILKIMGYVEYFLIFFKNIPIKIRVS